MNAMAAGRLSEALAALLPAAAAGILGLAGVWLVSTGRGWGRFAIGAAGLGLLALTVFTAATIGKVFFPPGIILSVICLWFPDPQP